MTIKGCMFDFSGTLLRVEATENWLRAVLDDARVPVTGAEVAEYAGRLERLGALPGGISPQVLPRHLERSWAERDLTPECHRAVYTGLARQAELPWGDTVYETLYARHMTPAAWNPYPDTAEVLRELRQRGIPVAVVSNIGWDLRPVFRAYGLDALVDTFVLSYEHGVQKPDPRLFRTACELLGLPPEQVAMVGDDRRADTGAAALGCPVHLVDHLPVDQRPDGLLPVLDLVG
ncbi:HAD-IA family hydrolase [Streptomyces sp. AK02-01A]|uniref:HAD family hydrolase n=1 Tax=Streptomyces sp. AK02-01A TaxID=3028648 RepID=UPI0029B55854|nr:HAD-IA family hydrolase [Streptomyces sp. AK02-01A]MDX3850636.1 HAD-IA family hydrolase [Streptomyces sp. AK02-01A]